ncbi:MAG: RagB/SusD family nutrient uptake outer membrane protein [Chitinophaga sp.]|uniref:RagB/SusD family nutrient uptake outer membrane protein n=1 Tax=Chitinophaga sp. TaxID=1869181 RepID=UPI001B29175F|nr:RagB/SusD family nutrient uptake outer membrane protein [Chitinophaga sp.]MBO9732850.1 RagB/SusD family nutrient uptake outer membrane protein [Chitinophaga sp.]
MKKLAIYSITMLVLFSSGCKKFLDVTPKGKFLPKTVAEYELFMNDPLIADACYGYEEMMTDDVAYTDEGMGLLGDGRSSRSYLWAKDLFRATEDDGEWNGLYRNIYNCNLVLQEIGTAKDGTPESVSRITAEAKIHRAFCYFHLANLFGNDYQAATANTDLAVPLLLKPDLEAKTQRATVQEVLNQVVKDLSEALAESGLPDMGRNYVHPGKAGAYALQARVYLFMGNYEQALKASSAALALKNTLLDYNTISFINPAKPYSGLKGLPTVDANPENILSRTTSLSGIITRFMISPDLLGILGEKDLRYVYSFTRILRSASSPVNPYPDYFGNYINYSIGVPEMMLIKAECLARNNSKDEAIDLLNTLRQKRFKPAEYTALTAATADEALVQVLQERRRELMYHGVRWFDLKRLNRDSRFKKDLTRSYKGTTYTLAANSSCYLLQIAPKIITINPAIIQNPR